MKIALAARERVLAGRCPNTPVCAIELREEEYDRGELKLKSVMIIHYIIILLLINSLSQNLINHLYHYWRQSKLVKYDNI